MKSFLKILLFTLGISAPFIGRAEPISVSMVANGYLVSGRHIDTIEQLLNEIQTEKNKEVVISFAPDAPMDKFAELFNALQVQGMKVGFVTSPAKQ